MSDSGSKSGRGCDESWRRSSGAKRHPASLFWCIFGRPTERAHIAPGATVHAPHLRSVTVRAAMMSEGAPHHPRGEETAGGQLYGGLQRLQSLPQRRLQIVAPGAVVDRPAAIAEQESDLRHPSDVERLPAGHSLGELFERVPRAEYLAPADWHTEAERLQWALCVLDEVSYRPGEYRASPSADQGVRPQRERGAEVR